MEFHKVLDMEELDMEDERLDTHQVLAHYVACLRTADYDGFAELVTFNNVVPVGDDQVVQALWEALQSRRARGGCMQTDEDVQRDMEYVLWNLGSLDLKDFLRSHIDININGNAHDFMQRLCAVVQDHSLFGVGQLNCLLKHLDLWPKALREKFLRDLRIKEMAKRGQAYKSVLDRFTVV